uniref:Ankyrin repeat protein n=1 Tax=Marseillevirus LCMAC102 TaxID=2506603 RepID=A0A481YU80_9VIRU|nr:MAG: ankyrin repeat protein [Marseillevirus LCMAC102]
MKHIIKKMSVGMQTKEKLTGAFYDQDAGADGGIIVHSSKKFHDVTDRWKTCAPQWAAESGQIKVIKYLVSLGVELKHLRAMNNYAIRQGKKYLNVIKILTDPWLTPEGGLTLEDLRCEGALIIQWSIENDKLETVKYLMNYGMTIIEVVYNGRIALGRAALNKDHSVIAYLMNLGLTINQMIHGGVFGWYNPIIPEHLLKYQPNKFP